jgi:hypothetical protein
MQSIVDTVAKRLGGTPLVPSHRVHSFREFSLYVDWTIEKIDECLVVHPCNRNIDTTWVKQLEIDMFHMPTFRTTPRLLMALNETEISNNMNQKEHGIQDGEEEVIVKAYILDGQHRIKALRQYLETSKQESYPMLVTFFVYRDEKEFSVLLNMVNRQRLFQPENGEHATIISNFQTALFSFMVRKDKGTTYQCYQTVRRNIHNYRAHIVNRCAGCSVEQIIEMLKSLSEHMGPNMANYKGAVRNACDDSGIFLWTHDIGHWMDVFQHQVL